MSKEHNRKSLVERGIDFSKGLDKIGIVGGVAVGLFFNPALGGVIAGGSIVSHEVGRDIENRLKNRRARKLGALATKDE